MTELDSDAPGRQPVRLRMCGLDWAVLAAVSVLYLATRLYGLEAFPAYFFCDEAIQAVLAEDLVRDGLRDADGRLLPALFLNVDKYSLGLTVWLYTLPVALFGKSVLVVRAFSACFGLVAAVSLMLTCKWFLRARLWWAAGLVLAALPAWFIHSRTAFETAFMTSCFAAFVLTYLLYREVSPRWLPAAVICGGATFSSYANGRGVMLVSAILLLAVDWRHHLRVIRERPRLAGLGALTGAAVLIPYLHFSLIREPDMVRDHLLAVESYWLGAQPLADKLLTFGSEYLRGLGPAYWFATDTGDLIRHRMPDTGHLPIWLAPFLLVGLLLGLRGLRRSPVSRVIVIAMLAAPFSAALAGLQITRALAMVIPAVLLVVSGLDWVQARLRPLVAERWTGAAVAVGLAAASVTMTARAVSSGAVWYDDYGLYGLQWGAAQVLGRVDEMLSAGRADRVAIDRSWANNPSVFGDFFLDDAQRSKLWWVDVDHLVQRRRPLVAPSTVFVLSSAAHERALAARELEVGPPLEILRTPDGKPGFYFVRMRYSDAADEMMEARRDPRRNLVSQQVTVGGSVLEVRHPELDSGSIELAFDGDLETLARTRDAQTTVVELNFARLRTLDGVRLHLWTGTYALGLAVTRQDGEMVRVRGSGSSPVGLRPMEMWLRDRVDDVKRLEIEITKTGDGHVHLREIEILP